MRATTRLVPVSMGGGVMAGGTAMQARCGMSDSGEGRDAVDNRRDAPMQAGSEVPFAGLAGQRTTPASSCFGPGRHAADSQRSVKAAARGRAAGEMAGRPPCSVAATATTAATTAAAAATTGATATTGAAARAARRCAGASPGRAGLGLRLCFGLRPDL